MSQDMILIFYDMRVPSEAILWHTFVLYLLLDFKNREERLLNAIWDFALFGIIAGNRGEVWMVVEMDKLY